MTARLRICLIASSRFPVAEPFAGGLEAHTHMLARELIARGHNVSLFAAPGSDVALNVRELSVTRFVPSEGARADVGASPDYWMREHHAYLGLMLDLFRTGARNFDIVHNNSLHHLPVAMAEATGLPVVTTLHTPPTPWLESAVQLAPERSNFVSVSAHTAQAWKHVVRSTVILNGVDTEQWSYGPGGGDAIWFGRIVPEKAPHLAIAAAREAGMSLRLAGPSLDPAYFESHIRPLLGDDIRYLGHLRHAELIDAVGSAAVSLVTPAWDEPYGLVAAESLACGTPVAAFARGALPEILDESCGRLAPADDVSALAVALREAARLPRRAARVRAERFCSAVRMVDDYERLYEGLRAERAVA